MRLFDRRFSALLGADTAANLADGIILLAFPLTAVSFGGQGWQVAMVTACAKLPWLLFGPAAGVLLDRYSRVKVARTATLARAVIFAALGGAIVAGSTNLGLLAVAAVLAGICEVFFDLASQTITPSVVAPENIVRATGYVSSAKTSANEFVGPPLGGLLVTAALWIPFVFSSVAYLVVGLIMHCLSHRVEPAESVPAHQGRGFRHGVAFIYRDVFLRRLTLYLAGVYLSFGAWIGLFVFYITSVSSMQLSSAEVGLLMAIAAVGGIAGGQGANQFVRWLGEYMVLALGALGWGLYMIGPLLADTLWVAAVFMIVGSALGTAMGVSSFALRLVRTPQQLLGRVSAVYRFVTWGALPLGSITGAALSIWFSTTPAMWIMTIAMFLLTVVALLGFRGSGRPRTDRPATG